MTITLNGAGSIAGLSQGGIPAGSQTPVAPQSTLKVHTASANGTTNTTVRRFQILGSASADVTSADSATLGGSFTVNTPGIYALSFTTDGSALGTASLSLNASLLGGNSAFDLPAMEHLASATVGGPNYLTNVCWTGYLPAGSVIRAHCNAPPSGSVQRTVFSMSRIA